MADEEDYSSLPLTERAQHKIWKVRLGAYEDMAKEFATSPDEGAPCFRPWLNDPTVWKKIVTDSNAVAQEAGLAALSSFIEFGGQNAALKTRSIAIPGIVEKCLSSARAGTRQKAIDTILFYVEVDTPEPVIEELTPGFSAKLPKLVAATTTAMKEIYRQFGARTISPKPALKLLPKLFAHSDKNVRAEAMVFTLVLYSWLGDAIKPSLSELKPLQLKELEDAFAGVDPGKAVQMRFLRSQKSVAGVAPDVPDEEEAAPIDAYDLAEPVDIRKSLPPEFNEWINSASWKDRKNALDALLATAKVPRIKEENYQEIMGTLSRCMKDSNIVVVTSAAACVEAIARGLRRPFSQYRHLVLGPLIEKLKERKTSVVEALSNAMDGVFTACGFSDVLDDMQEGFKHKNPQVKAESLRFLIRCLRTTPSSPNKAETQIVGEAAIKLLGDTAEPVRAAAQEALGTLMKIVGERAMIQFLDPVDDIRKAKIREFFEKAEVKAKQRTAPPPKPAGPGAKRPGAPNGKVGGGVAKVAGGASGIARTGSLKRPGSVASSVDREPDSPKKPTIVRPGMRPPTTTSSSASSSTGSAPPSRFGPRQSVVPSARAGSPVQPPAPRKAPSDDPPKLSRGLMGRNVATPTEPPMTNPERAELDILRAEKSKWEVLREEDRAEKGRLLQELNDLRSQNAEMVENHTRDLLQLKAKETQLARSRNDAELTQAALSKALRDLDALRVSSGGESAREVEVWRGRAERAEARVMEREELDGNVLKRLTELEEFAAGRGGDLVQRLNDQCAELEEQNRRLLTQNDEYATRITALEDSLKRRATSPFRNGNSIYSARSSPSLDPDDEKENYGQRKLASAAGSNAHFRNSMESQGSEIHSWRSAAEVTAALKMKIEQMRRADSKNRQQGY